MEISAVPVFEEAPVRDEFVKQTVSLYKHLCGLVVVHGKNRTVSSDERLVHYKEVQGRRFWRLCQAESDADPSQLSWCRS